MKNIYYSVLIVFLFGVNFLSAQTALLTGRVVLDLDSNCIVSTGDKKLHDIVIEAYNISTGLAYYSNSSYYANGTYEISLPVGSYVLKARQPFDMPYANFCQNSVAITLFAGIPDTLDFVSIPVLPCALPMVEMSTAGVPDCGVAKYVLRYQNIGTLSALNTYIDIELDPEMTLDSASFTLLPLGGNQYRIAVGTLNIGRDSGGIGQIYVSQCPNQVGHAYCVKSTISASNTCPSFWQGPVLEMKGHCVGDSVLFTTQNIGRGPMLTAGTRKIIIDDVMYLPPIGPTLDTLQTDSLWITAQEGVMYRLEMQQDSLLPKVDGKGLAWAAVEGCKPNQLGGFHVGSFTQHYSDNSTPKIDQDCQEGLDEILYNNKRVLPKGYGFGHYINPKTPLEYQVRFENTGPTMAQSIEIIDTLSPYLDISSLQIGAVSHPKYEITLSGQNMLSIRFPEIYLPNTTQNSANANGFINFYFDQKDNVPLNAVIENRTSIVINYYDTVRTATVYNTVGQGFIQILSTKTVYAPAAQVRLYPNPVQSLLNVEVSGIEFSTLAFELYNALGQLVYRSEAPTTDRMQLQLPDLEAGIYFYQVRADGQLLDSGRVVAQ